MIEIVSQEVEIVPNSDDEDEMPDDGNRYFMTLMRDDMQIRLGACVYVMKENHSKRYSYKKFGGLRKENLDIFRIERLWKNQKYVLFCQILFVLFVANIRAMSVALLLLLSEFASSG